MQKSLVTYSNSQREPISCCKHTIDRYVNSGKFVARTFLHYQVMMFGFMITLLPVKDALHMIKRNTK